MKLKFFMTIFNYTGLELYKKWLDAVEQLLLYSVYSDIMIILNQVLETSQEISDKKLPRCNYRIEKQFAKIKKKHAKRFFCKPFFEKSTRGYKSLNKGEQLIKFLFIIISGNYTLPKSKESVKHNVFANAPFR